MYQRIADFLSQPRHSSATQFGLYVRCTKDSGHSFANVVSGWTVPETDQSSINVYKTRDLQIASVATSTATKSFSMAHKMGLIQINMKKATAPETRTYTANSVTKAYDSGNVEFYALNVFDGTNLPYSSSCPGTVSYFIVKYSSGNYSFTTPYKALNNGSTTGAVSQWTMSAVTAPASGKCTSATTSNPMFKNLGRLYSYTGTSQTYTPMLTGFKYQMECWGARGASGSGTYYGKGAYTSGVISINTIENYFVYVGQEGTASVASDSPRWNGGGAYGGVKDGDGSGGGATDIRLKACSSNSAWYEYPSLCSRIMVAGGGGSSDDVCSSSTYSHTGGVTVDCYAHAGGLTAYHSYQSGGSYTDTNQTRGGTAGNYETYNGVFGSGNRTAASDVSGGGGGYYGGGGGDRGTCGGSSFISGHSGCNAITKEVTAESSITHSGQANHYSGKKFTSTVMIDGAGYNWTTKITGYVQMPNPSSATGKYALKTGHDNNGYARIICKPYD